VAASSAGAGGEHDEAPLWQRWRGGDGSAREKLIERYLPYSKAIAARLYARRPIDDVEFEEYQQFATVGLLESIDRYRPDRGAQFTTFATPRIRGAVLSGVERLTERRQQTAFRRRAMSERVASLVQDDVSPNHTQALLDELEKIGVGVALGLILEGTGMLSRPEDGLPDDAYAQVELRQAHQRLWEMVKHLTDRERQVVELHYREARRFEEIARTLRLSKGRVSQLHRQALTRLHGLMTAAEACDVAY
jgi:RNA polymerase sigma factor for flagellar operon FliA